ncbi:hypothetical protein QJS10_CPA03g01260 [Acorus calamus]|uniref:CCHC-type domain-containing protein n=1 Tax=Acorus calamus TaxID=4465 RepID=A0AAV9F7M8_ACOCL|nr:hypothetical protein QJS10_CPA03g01260 [Acorus calamus]
MATILRRARSEVKKTHGDSGESDERGVNGISTSVVERVAKAHMATWAQRRQAATGVLEVCGGRQNRQNTDKGKAIQVDDSWQQVSYRRKKSAGRPSSGSHRAGPSRLTVVGTSAARSRHCFRCLGLGHFAFACRDPPRCWKCNGVGHRRSGCNAMNRVHYRSRAPKQCQEVFPSAPWVVVSWSKEVANRMSKLQRCVLVLWSGPAISSCDDLVRLLGLHWRDMDFGNVGWLCRNRALIRLPTILDRDRLLECGTLTVPGGAILFAPYEVSTGAHDDNGVLRRIVLSGVPLAWRTEEAIRLIVEPLGTFQSMYEDASGDGVDVFPHLSVAVWSNSSSSFPRSIEGGRVMCRFERWGDASLPLLRTRFEEADIRRGRRLFQRGRSSFRPLVRTVLCRIGSGGLDVEGSTHPALTLIDGPVTSQPRIPPANVVGELASVSDGALEDVVHDRLNVLESGELQFAFEESENDQDLSFIGVNIGNSPSLSDFELSPVGAHSPSLGSTPSYHGSLGQGSWANQVGDDGVARWVWFRTSDKGFSGSYSSSLYLDPIR